MILWNVSSLTQSLRKEGEEPEIIMLITTTASKKVHCCIPEDF